MDLRGKVVWITGASSGIGKELAIQLSKKESKLILSSNESLEETIAKCVNEENINSLQFDLTDHNKAKSIVASAINFFGKVDILINNAGMTHYYLATEDTMHMDKKVFDVNYFGTIAITKALLPHFIKKNKGFIAVTTSVTGKYGIPYRTSYAASKHALCGFFDSLRIELYNTEIGILLFGPGFTKTNILKNALGVGKAKSIEDNKSHSKGMPVEKLVAKYIKAIQKEKKEKYTGRKEKTALVLKKIAPRLLERLLSKIEV